MAVSSLPKSLDLAKFKRLLSILMATYTECYIDPFGVVYGISQNDYTIGLTRINGTEYEKLLPFIKDRYMPTTSTYAIVKDLKKTKCDAIFAADGGILTLTDSTDGENRVRLYEPGDVPNLQIIYQKYEKCLPGELYDALKTNPASLLPNECGVDKDELDSVLINIQSGGIGHYSENGQVLAFDKTMIPAAKYVTEILPKMVYTCDSHIFWNLHIKYEGLETDIITHTIRYT